MTPQAGELFAGRFRVLRRAGAGGMGVVYSAEDTSSGELVALKVLHPDQKPERFLREAEVLAQLAHPAVVRYVAHGVSSEGVVYLAMEWLEGKSLSRLLAERRLTFAEVALLLGRVLGGLALAHGRGVVHRDLKPGNIVIADGELARAKLIDFGIARRRMDPRLTERGFLVGTLSYMSPEQARGVARVEPASDVFSLGSVVYKCLTGETPFHGADPTAVLAKVLLDEPVPLVELVSGVPKAFDDLVSRMLAKEPANRPPDATAVLAELAELGDLPPESRAAAGIGDSEQRVVWVALRPGEAFDEPETVHADLHTLDQSATAVVARLVESAGGRFDTLANGSRVASFVGSGAARDGALGAVRVAGAMLEAFPGRPVAVATGLGVVGGRAPFGSAIERGAELLSRAHQSLVHLDRTTARLVGSELEVIADASSLVLTGAPRRSDGIRRLLGRPTPCVGRERELETLAALVQESFEERVSRVAVVTAPAGVGKSRLRYELLQRVKVGFPDVCVLSGRGDSINAGSPFALLRQALRAELGVRDGEPLQSMRDKVNRIGTSESERSLAKTRAFIGELAGVPFEAAAHDALESARANPTLLGDYMRAAWLDFLAGVCRERPVLLVLEDLHWGDLPTVTYADAALANLERLPFCVVALARPQVDAAFPRLFARREPVSVALGPLRRGPAESLVREVLGAELSEEEVSKIVARADGNAFFLEELIRAVADGHEDLPETVMAMVQSRLDALSASSRRVLRAASTFGEQFWHQGVGALLGDSSDHESLERELAALTTLELVSRRPTSSLDGDVEYVFRHATVRETAYASFTSDDRCLAHRLAAEWLEQVGATDSLTLAEHFRQGGCPERAAPWYLAAAEEALEGTDLSGAISRAARALEHGASGETRGALHYVTADAHFWGGDYEPALSEALLAVTLLPRGSSRWFLAVGALANAAATLEHDGLLTEWIERGRTTPASSEAARASQVVCLIRGAHGHHKRGRYAEADALIDTAEALCSELGPRAPLGTAWVHHGRAGRAYYAGDVGTFIREVQAAIDDFDLIGDGRAAANGRSNLGYAALSVGDLPRAETLLRESLALCERLSLGGVTHYAKHNLGLVLAYRGCVEEGLVLEREALEDALARKEGVLICAANMYLALILSLAGSLDEAEACATSATVTAKDMPFLLAQSHAVRSSVWLAQGKHAQALDEAEVSVRLLADRGGSEESEARVRAAYVAALMASGRSGQASSEARAAVTRIRERAARLGDPELERCYLEKVPEHAQLIAVAAVVPESG